MTPSREWLKKDEIVTLVHETVEGLFSAYTQKVNERLNSQDKELATIRANQDNFHAENKRRLDGVEKDTKNILQFQMLEQERQKGREQAEAKYLRDRDARELYRSQRLDRFKNWATIIAALVGVFSALGISNFVHRWAVTGHIFTH